MFLILRGRWPRYIHTHPIAGVQTAIHPPKSMQDFLDTRHGYVSAAGVELPAEKQVLIVSCPTCLVHCNTTAVPASSKNGDPGTRGTTYVAVHAS